MLHSVGTTTSGPREPVITCTSFLVGEGQGDYCVLYFVRCVPPCPKY